MSSVSSDLFFPGRQAKRHAIRRQFLCDVVDDKRG